MDSAPDASPAEEALDESAGRSRDFVQSLERGLAIIRVFGPQQPAMTVSEISAELGLTRAAVRRFLLTLSELGYVRAQGNRFELTPRVLELGYSYLSALSFPDIALPRLEQLVAATSEASEGSILDDGDIVYVVRVPGPAMMTISVNVGARRPAYVTAMGRVLLAHLPEDQLEAYLATHELEPILPRTITSKDVFRGELDKVRKQGFALVNQELEEGLVAVAVPVRDRSGRVRAAINLSTHVGRKSVEEMQALVPEVQAAARDIETELRHSPN
ncbi:IclR family transcriptional regulator domain-containing protein [Mycolicibacterium sphagni]|uniref:IclR family transcriptional regulator domain-containing protein n=1 Tax=Mycolicibacterium sphagni TaxID=1786 RepID=UPI0021F279E7|nr:IclR family transcriptional regulator C-terminal domain-containing protein [Mycolicibacterium sphagni]MCV7175283.1 helix-turn-helix domain-containing protein [Mycolicibacterium sphagni]